MGLQKTNTYIVNAGSYFISKFINHAFCIGAALGDFLSSLFTALIFAILSTSAVYKRIYLLKPPPLLRLMRKGVFTKKNYNV